MDEFSKKRLSKKIIPVENYSPNYEDDLESFLNYCINVFNHTIIDSTKEDIILRNLIRDVNDLIKRKEG